MNYDLDEEEAKMSTSEVIQATQTSSGTPYAETHFTKQEKQKLFKKFMRFSENGFLTYVSFNNLYKSVVTSCSEDIEPLLQHFFRVFSERKRSKIDFEEFITCLSVTTRGTLGEKIEWIFRLYDVDGNGTIEVPEVMEIVNAAHCYEDRGHILKLFDKMDLNKDNVLSHGEFSGEVLNDFTFLRIVSEKMGKIRLPSWNRGVTKIITSKRFIKAAVNENYV